MLLILIVLLLAVLIFGLYFFFRLVKWILKKKTRIKLTSVLVGVIILATLVNHLFFKNMKFIQSKVYPDLYIVKYPIKDKDSIHRTIKKMVLEKVNSEFLNNNGAYVFSNKRAETLQFRLRFYEYYTGTFFLIPFGDAGTTHFIENEEDPGGFSSEEISNYNKYRIAEFNIKSCKNDTINFVGTIDFYRGRDVIKTDTIINQCQIIYKDEEPSEAATDLN